MTRRGTSLWMLVWVAAIVAVPLAAGHGTAYDRHLWLGDEPVLVEIHGAPFPVAGEHLSLQVILPLRHPDDAPDIKAYLTAPNGTHGEPEALRPADGRHTLAVRFAEPGAWSVTVLVEGRPLEDSFEVRPAGLVFVTPDERLASAGALVVGEPERLTLRAQDLHGREVAAATDVVARVETWDASGERLLDVQEMRAARTGPGIYEVSNTWAEPGLVRATLASEAWGLSHEDRPPVEILVVSREEAAIYAGAEPAQEVPFLGFGLTILGCAAGALALAWRRQR